MPSGFGWEEGPRFSLDRWRPFSPLSDDGVGHNVTGRRISFSYNRLPEHFLKLSVLKLDGSSFDVQIMRTASVSELKLAVEEVFSQSPKEDGGKISWSHVWGHFCLCYEDHKLIDNKASLRTFGIKDGDQLHFIRHLSINDNPIKRRPKNHGLVLEQYRMSMTEPEVHEESEEIGKEKDDENDNDQYTDEQYHNYEENDLVRQTQFKLATFLRGWLSYSRLPACKLRSEGKTRPSRFGINGLRFGSK